MTLLLGMPGGFEWTILFFIGFLFLIPKIFYLLTLQSTLDAISPANRKMPSGNVWLLLIPLFGIVWHFIVIGNLADSIKAETNSRRIAIAEQKPAYNIGLPMCILDCLFFIPFLNFLTGLASLVLWILYWVKINEYKNLLTGRR